MASIITFMLVTWVGSGIVEVQRVVGTHVHKTVMLPCILVHLYQAHLAWDLGDLLKGFDAGPEKLKKY